MEATTDTLAGHVHGRVPADVRRRQIVQLAGELFAERGYHGASMGELARRAGISKPVIYDLIGSKEDVYRASCEEVVAEYAQAVGAAVVAHDEPAAQLRAGAVAAFELAAKHERAAAVLFSSEGGTFAEEIDWLRHRRGELIAGLLAAQAPGTPDPVQLEAVGHALGGAFEALALWWKEHKDVEVETLADWFVGLTLTGLERIGAAEEV